MTNFANLFKLLETTRCMPQYGYALAGIGKNEQSDLAQHHYMVSMIAWQICDYLIANDYPIDTAKTLKLAMIHDLGELFGGDISWYYGRSNPEAKIHAKAFEVENVKYIDKYFPRSSHFAELHEELFAEVTTESIVAKIADYTELTHYKFLNRRLTPRDIESGMTMLLRKVAQVNDPKARTLLEKFLRAWQADFDDKTVDALMT